MSQGELLNNMVSLTGLSRKEARSAMEAYKTIGAFEMKKRGIFVLPGFAKFTVKKLPAKPARKGINPFTREECIFKAKPARKVRLPSRHLSLQLSIRILLYSHIHYFLD